MKYQVGVFYFVDANSPQEAQQKIRTIVAKSHVHIPCAWRMGESGFDEDSGPHEIQWDLVKRVATIAANGEVISNRRK